MPRSRSPSPYTKSRSSDKSSRHLKTSSSRKRSPSDKQRNSSRSTRRSRSPSHKSRYHSPLSERTRTRRSRSASPRRNRRSSSKTNKSSRHYPSSTSRRRSRSREPSYRHKSKSSRRRHESSSSNSSSSHSDSSSRSSSHSRSKSPVSRPTVATRDQYIALTKEHPKTKRQPSPPRTTIFASVDQLLDEPIMPETLDKINSDEFVSRTFTSKKAASEKVIIDLDRQTVSVPNKVSPPDEDDPIFYPNLYADDAVRMEKWVKKMYIYRQKSFLGN